MDEKSLFFVSYEEFMSRGGDLTREQYNKVLSNTPTDEDYRIAEENLTGMLNVLKLDPPSRPDIGIAAKVYEAKDRKVPMLTFGVEDFRWLTLQSYALQGKNTKELLS